MIKAKNEKLKAQNLKGVFTRPNSIPFLDRVSLGGFSLIEVLITVFVLSVALVGVLAMFSLGIRVEKSAKMTSIASYLAQSKLEEIIAKPYDEISLGSFIEPYEFDPDFPSYRRETEINYVDPSQDLSPTTSDLGIKKVEMTVFWKFLGQSSEKEIKIFTLISER